MKKFYVTPESEELEVIEEALLAASEKEDIEGEPIDPQPAGEGDYEGW